MNSRKAAMEGPFAGLDGTAEKGYGGMDSSEKPEAKTEMKKDIPDFKTLEFWKELTSNKKVKRTAIGLLIWAILATVGPCTITHKFGPYYGKIVDAETGEPIEGAVVLVSFHTELYTPAGTMSKFVDALEVMTDAKGEFKIPAYRAWVFRTPHAWDTYANFVIFKPGYGSFPWHKEVQPRFTPGDTLPPDEYVVMRLPKLKTRDEAVKNLYFLPHGSVPREKMKKFLELLNTEEARSWTHYN